MYTHTLLKINSTIIQKLACLQNTNSRSNEWNAFFLCLQSFHTMILNNGGMTHFISTIQQTFQYLIYDIFKTAIPVELKYSASEGKTLERSSSRTRFQPGHEALDGMANYSGIQPCPLF